MSPSLSKVRHTVQNGVKRVLRGGQHGVYAPDWEESSFGESQSSHFSNEGFRYNNGQSMRQGRCRDKMRRLFTGRFIIVLTLLIGIIVSVILASVSTVGKSNEKELPTEATPPPSPGGNLGDLDLAKLPDEKDPTLAPSKDQLSTPAPDERRISILKKVETISGNKVRRKSTAQHIAAEWLIVNDKLYLDASSPYLIQRYVVALIYYAMGGRYAWTGDYNWMDGDTNECQWTGIECNSNSFITKIELEKVGLTGYIPGEISGLPHLAYLNLSQNHIFGSIPNDFGMMNSLQTLFLEKNDLNGNVENAICQLREKGTLQAFTTDCGKTNSKIKCDCCTNCPKTNNSVPAQIDTGSNNLPAVDLKSHDKGISNVLHIVSGETIFINNTPQNKAYAWIVERDLLKLGEDSENLVQRYVIALMYFQLSGESWKTKSWLSPYQNECSFKGITCDKYYRITEIDLSNQMLTGELPAEISRLSFLTGLNLGFNRISGNIPVQWGGLMMLEFMSLKSNNLKGSVPTRICNLKNERLRTFYVDCMKLSCNCCNSCVVKPVTKPYNELPSNPSMSAPLELSAKELSFTEALKSVSHRQDTLPDSPRKKAIHWLANIDAQNLSVGDPKLVQRYVMVLLYYSLNGDDWTIENWLYPGTSECEWKGISCSGDGEIMSIILQSKNLHGLLPYELEQLTHLKILDLSKNSIKGPIPEELQNSSSLSVLKLYSNKLIGQVPNGVCMLKEMGSLSEIWVDCNSNDQYVVHCASTCCTKCGPNGDVMGHPPIYLTTAKPTMKPTVFNPYKTKKCTTDESDNRPVSIMEQLKIVSNLNEKEMNLASAHPNSPRYNALDWIVEKDQLKLSECQDNLKQRYILALLFFAMNGDHWTDGSDWLNGTTFECEWKGVACDEKGKVNTVALKGMGLDGTIPYEVASLMNLKELDMSNNNIKGPIPQEFQNLAMLEILILHNNQMTGTVSDFVCELKDEGSLGYFWMDCDETSPHPVTCSCCTKCASLP